MCSCGDDESRSTYYNKEWNLGPMVQRKNDMNVKVCGFRRSVSRQFEQRRLVVGSGRKRVIPTLASHCWFSCISLIRSVLQLIKPRLDVIRQASAVAQC